VVTARLTGAMHKLLPRRPQPRPQEPAPTTALPEAAPTTALQEAAPTTALQQPAEEKIPSPSPERMSITGTLQARRVRLSVDGD
jgi:hypothetical protein